MAAPILRNYNVRSAAAGTSTLVPAVPAGRALVVSKLVLATDAPAPGLTVSVFVGGFAVVRNLVLAPGEHYTETGLVVPATATVTVAVSGANLDAALFGEEVDN